MKLATRFFFALIPLLAAQASHAERFYKWVDDAGATHYTQTPPPQKIAATAVKVSTKLPSDSNSAVKNLAALSTANASAVASEEKAVAKDQAAAAADAERRKKNAAACAQNQTLLGQLQSGQRLHMQDAKGERMYLTEDQKATQIQQVKAQIQQNCPK